MLRQIKQQDRTKVIATYTKSSPYMYNALSIEGQQKIYNIALEIIGKQKNHELMKTREKREKSETKIAIL